MAPIHDRRDHDTAMAQLDDLIESWQGRVVAHMDAQS
jgi:hypothetical protein